MRFIIVSTILMLSFLSVSSAAADSNTVRVCGDRDPLAMTLDIKPGVENKNPEVIGFSVDMVRAIFASLGKNVEFIEDLPWKRCLNEVENGKIDFAMDAYFNLEREKIFEYSTHYHSMTPQIFYLDSKPVDYSRIEKLKKYHGCGILGTSYTHYGMRPENFDLGADRVAMIKKLFAGHCDYFLEDLEDIASYKSTGVDYLANPVLRHGTIAWAVPPSKFLITIKNSKNAQMMDQINSSIYTIIKSGQAEKFWKKIHIGLPYKP